MPSIWQICSIWFQFLSTRLWFQLSDMANRDSEWQGTEERSVRCSLWWWWPIFLAGAHMIYVAYRYLSGVVSKLFIFLLYYNMHFTRCGLFEKQQLVCLQLQWYYMISLPFGVDNSSAMNIPYILKTVVCRQHNGARACGAQRIKAIVRMRNKRAIVLTRDSATYQLPKLECYFQKVSLTGVLFYQFQPPVWGSSSNF